MRTLAVAAVLLGLVLAAGNVSAEIGTLDEVPAATLLLPYFEVDLNNPGGRTTLFSINNASAAAVLTQVTLWTDEAIPTFGFSVYLTGYDVQTINLRDVFNGLLPVTADSGIDPDPPGPSGGNVISNRGTLSGDSNFPGVGPCGDLGTIYSNFPPDAALVQHYRLAHTGGPSPVYGGRCSGFNYGDNVARGYITVDVVTQCALEFPSSPGYFAGIAALDNVIWGDVFYVNPGENFAQGNTLVHIEACGAGTTPGPYVGFVGTGTSGVNTCPFAAGDYTFYGRYVGGTAADQRESLGTTFATRYINGGVFNGGTSLLVWRDPKTPVGNPGAANGPFNCGGNATWFPLNQSDVVSFDEQENPTDLCFQGDNFPPPVGGAEVCFPLATQRVSLQGGNIPGDDLNIPTPFGWLFLNLNTTVAGGLFNPTAQAWVGTAMDAEGRFSVGFSAIHLDNANQTFQSANPGGLLLLP